MIGKYGYRVVKARWTRKGPEPVFPAEILVTGEDGSGILNSISEAIAKDLKISVRSINLDTEEGMIRGRISLMVRDIEHLQALIKRLASLKGIYSVRRSESGNLRDRR